MNVFLTSEWFFLMKKLTGSVSILNQHAFRGFLGRVLNLLKVDVF